MQKKPCENVLNSYDFSKTFQPNKMHNREKSPFDDEMKQMKWFAILIYFYTTTLHITLYLI